jgi:transcriptional regulator with XRE-family HTH domain
MILLVMGKTTPSLVPRVSRLLNGVGTHLKLARLRRKYSAETVAQRAGITRRTLSKVEQGDPAVAFGVYARVMQVLRLEDDLALLAVDDELGRKLQDAGITSKLRAPKRISASNTKVEPEQSLQDVVDGRNRDR